MLVTSHQQSFSFSVSLDFRFQLVYFYNWSFLRMKMQWGVTMIISKRNN